MMLAAADRRITIFGYAASLLRWWRLNFLDLIENDLLALAVLEGGEPPMHSKSESKAVDAIKLIEKTYVATLEPQQLTAFEAYWESYVDSVLSEDSTGIDQQEIDKHLLIALDILQRVEHSDDKLASSQKLVDEEPGPALLIESNGAIVASNSLAKHMVGEATNFWDLELDANAVRRIRDWIGQGRANVRQTPFFVHSHLAGALRKQCLFLAPVKADPGSRENILISRIDATYAPEALSAFQNTYDLSAAEADVAFKLTDGLSPAEVADARGASIHTVRTQIKSLLRKTDVRGIPDLVRVFSNISARLAVSESAAPGSPGQVDGQSMLRYGRMTLADGRQLEYLEQGHPNGSPVLFLHSLITDVGLSRTATRKAVMAGLRFITPIRAGYGNSDPNPTRDIEVAVENTATDLHALLGHLGIKQAVLVSGWAGCFAQRFASKYPEKVSGLILLRSVPLWRDDFLPSMRPRYRNIVKSSIHLPSAVPYLAKLGKILMDSGRESTFARGMNRERERDLKSLEDPQIMETVSRSYHCISKQGTDTFVFELKSIHRDWSHHATQVRVPTTIIVEDDFLDFPKKAFDQYVDLVPHAKLSTVKGAGEYLYLTHFDALLQEISEFQTE